MLIFQATQLFPPGYNFPSKSVAARNQVISHWMAKNWLTICTGTHKAQEDPQLTVTKAVDFIDHVALPSGDPSFCHCNKEFIINMIKLLSSSCTQQRLLNLLARRQSTFELWSKDCSMQQVLSLSLLLGISSNPSSSSKERIQLMVVRSWARSSSCILPRQQMWHKRRCGWVSGWCFSEWRQYWSHMLQPHCPG